jgi:hypothetical protein
MKIYELLIDEEDELSGVSLLSLVKSPATQMSWEVFNNHICEAECFAEVDINPDLLSVLEKYGDKMPEGLLDYAEILNDEEQNVVEKFYSVSSTPNRKDPLNDLSLDSITRYIYTIDVGAGAVLKPESRQFCRKMIGAGRVYSREDLRKISAEIASDPNTFKIIPRSKNIGDVDVFEFKGGKNCYHRYRMLVFNLKEGQTYDELLASIPGRAAQAIPRAELIDGSDRPFLSEALHYNFGKRKSLKPSNFYMGLFFYNDVFSAFVDEPEARNFTKIRMCEYEGWCPMYVAEEYFEGGAEVIDRFEIKEMFVEVPQYIREAADRAQKWAEENGWGSCGTAVGKRRSADLADPNYNPSADVLARMYSYGSRHKQDWEASKSFEDGCGSLMMASWGFTPDNYDSAMNWLENQLEKTTMKQQTFAVDNFKGEITAVVFEPDQYIYRFSEGKSYYVFMSRETIKKMLMKVSRLKEAGKMENFINLEHSDMIFNADDVYTYENWLVGNDPVKDKSYEIFGREMKPGTWITTIAFRNKELFEKYVLSNKTTGISLEGLFQEVPFNFNEVSRETFVEPSAGESESDYVGRCIPKLLSEGYEQDQATAICYNTYKEKFDFPKGTCWDGFEPYGTKIVDGREVPNCVPIKASINTEGMTPYVEPATTGLTTEEVFEYVGDYEGAPAYSTESGADSKAKEMGCEGTHYMEGQGYFPCKTHKEAADLYESQKIYEMVVEVMKNYTND